MNAPLLKVERLVKHFPVKGGILGRTVDKVHAVVGGFHLIEMLRERMPEKLVHSNVGSRFTFGA